MKVLALDLSKTSCGYAVGDGDTPPRLGSSRFVGETPPLLLSAFQRWLTSLVRSTGATMIVNETTLKFSGRETTNQRGQKKFLGGSTASLVLMLRLEAVVLSTAGLQFLPHREVAPQTWRKDFLGHGRPSDPKAAALAMCETLGWETAGIHDRADAAGIWAWAHLHYGNASGVHRLLSESAVRRMS